MAVDVPNLTKRIEERIIRDINKVKTAVPAVVEGVYPQDMKVDVYVKAVWGDKPTRINNVRLIYPQSYNSKILFNISRGDTVMLIFNKYTVLTLQNEQFIDVSKQSDWKLNDVVAIPSVHLDKKLRDGEDESSINGNDVKIPDGIMIASENEVLISGNDVRFDSEIVLSGDGKMVRKLWLIIGGLPKAPQENPPPIVGRGAGAALKLEDGKKTGVYGKIKIPDRIDDGEEIQLNINWDAPTTGEDCVWEIVYGMYESDDDMTQVDVTDTFTGTSSSSANGLVRTNYTIPSADFDRDELFLSFTLRRLGGDTNDTINDSVYVHGIGFKYYVTQIGAYEM